MRAMTHVQRLRKVNLLHCCQQVEHYVPLFENLNRYFSPIQKEGGNYNINTLKNLKKFVIVRK